MAKAQILVVEDDNIIALELEDRLGYLGYETCAQTASGEDAIIQAETLQPDLVLMDIRLRGAMDGVEAAAEIRNRFDIPVVYLTAYADANTLQRAKITEPYGYIIKPFEEKELHTAIEVALYKHKMERRLKESERWLATTLKSIGDGVIATDQEGRVMFMNPVAGVLTGWRQGDALGKRAEDIFKIEDEETYAAVTGPVARVIRDGQTLSLAKHLLVARDGTQIPIDGSIAPIRDERDNVSGAVLAFQNISERKREQDERERLQAQLFQAQKMEAIGMLAGGIAHDFNNLMTTVIGSSSLILSDLPEQDPDRDALERIRKAGRRAAALTQQILALSRRQTPEPQILDLNTVIIDMQDILERLVSEDVELIHALDPGFRCVKADPSQIEQVLMNLIINAHEAMPEGGKITITTETVTLGRGMVEAQQEPAAAQEEGAFVCLTVKDIGIGIAEQDMGHIFEPFYSTKPKGTGLGLSIANNIIQQHNGWIDVESQLGQGTEFRIYLPAIETDADLEEIRGPAPIERLGKGERILLVEDDEGVREAVSEMLHAGGYIVIETESAERALDTFEEQQGDFDLILSDVVLPDKDGIELVEQCLLQKPDLPVLLTSGYTDHRSQWLLISEKGYRFIQKPFGISDLLPIVHQTMHPPRKKSKG